MTSEIHRDAWGIPHLRAGSARELARAQGVVTARDRAWQLEVERHRAQGTSASFLGADALPWDLFARRARLDDTARRCWAALVEGDQETADWVRAYVDGVNAELPATTAPEFGRAGLAPGRWQPWTPLAVWLATHILFAGFPAKLWREEALRHLGPSAVGLFATDGPGSAGSNGWLLAGSGPPPATPSSPATRTASSRTPASTSRSISPAPSSTSSASPSPASRASLTSVTPARSPGPSPTQWPTTRTSTVNDSDAPERAWRPSTPTGHGDGPTGTWSTSRWPANHTRSSSK